MDTDSDSLCVVGEEKRDSATKSVAGEARLLV